MHPSSPGAAGDPCSSSAPLSSAARRRLPRVDAAWVRAHAGACVHAGRSIAQADLFELEWKGRPALLKDFAARPWPVRRWWGRAIIAREVRALERLRGIDGVPRVWALAGRTGFIMERLDARRLPQRGEPPPPPAFWADARRLLEAIHAAGVAHGDLRRKNLLIDDHGRACLIDFATAVRAAPGAPPLKRFLFERCRRIDRVTFARIKAGYDPALLDATERRWLAEEPWYLKIGRWLKRRVYRLRTRRFWRDVRRRWTRRLRGISDRRGE